MGAELDPALHPTLYFLSKIHIPGNPPLLKYFILHHPLSSTACQIPPFIYHGYQQFPQYYSVHHHLSPPNTIMVTIDVILQYPNICHYHYLSAMEHSLSRSREQPLALKWPLFMPICHWISWLDFLHSVLEKPSIYWWHFRPLALRSQLSHPLPWSPQWPLSCQIHLVYLLLMFLDNNMSLDHGISTLSIYTNLQKISISPAFTLHPPSTPSPSLWSSGGGKSAVILMASTPTAQISPNFSSSKVIPIHHNETNFPYPHSYAVGFPKTPMTLTPTPLLPHTMLISLSSKASSENVFTLSPRPYHP